MQGRGRLDQRLKCVRETRHMVLRTPRGGDRYEKNRRMAQEALEFLEGHVVGHGAVPSPDTLVSVISAAAQLRGVRNGQACHPFVLGNELESDVLGLVLHKDWSSKRCKEVVRRNDGGGRCQVELPASGFTMPVPGVPRAFCCNLSLADDDTSHSRLWFVWPNCISVQVPKILVYIYVGVPGLSLTSTLL
jgi:hypothetical protein